MWGRSFIDEEVQALVSLRPFTSDELESCRERAREQLRVHERENSCWFSRIEVPIRKVRSRTSEQHLPIEQQQGDGDVAEQIDQRSLIPLHELESTLSIAALRHQRVEDMQLADIQSLVPYLFPQDAVISAVLLPASSNDDVAPAEKRQRTA